jgi:hypothetical protein
MITAKTGFEECQELLVSSTSTLFNLLIEDVPLTRLKYLTPLADKGVYIATEDNDKLLRLECESGKNVLLQELKKHDVPPQVVLNTYLKHLFWVLEKTGIKEKTEILYYVGGRFVKPLRVTVADHPLGFMRGEYTLFDKVIAGNYRVLQLVEPKRPPFIIYNPLYEFDNLRSANMIFVFEKTTREELAAMEFKTSMEAKEIFLSTTHYHINEILFGFIKFKIRKVLGI